MFDAAAGFGGYRQSGFGRDGGREGLFEYVKPAWQVGMMMIVMLMLRRRIMMMRRMIMTIV